jgi:hypothetical protein
LGETTNGELIPWGKPWDRQPISGKLRRKFGVSPTGVRGTRKDFRVSLWDAKSWGDLSLATI